jgi:hypothetical protein
LAQLGPAIAALDLVADQMGEAYFGNSVPEAPHGAVKLVKKWMPADHGSRMSLMRAMALLAPVTLDSRSRYASDWEMSGCNWAVQQWSARSRGQK